MSSDFSILSDNDDLPMGWCRSSLIDISERITKGTTPTSLGYTFKDKGILFVKVESLSNKRINHSICTFIDEETNKALIRSSLKERDILFSIAGTLGRVAIVQTDDLPANTNQAIAIIRLASSSLSSEYIATYLSSNLLEQSIREQGRGVGLQNLNLKQVGEFVVSLPPLNEQRRIVEKVEALMARSRKAKEALDAIPKLIEQFRQSVLAAAFRGDLTADWREQNPNIEPASVLLERIRKERREKWEQTELEKMRAKGKEPLSDEWKKKYKEPESVNDSDLPELPDGWCWVRTEEVCEFITKGTTPSSDEMFDDFKNDTVPFIKVYNLTDNGKLDFSINPTFTERAIHEGKLARSKVYSGDILMNIVGPPLGKVSIVPDDYPEWNINQAIVLYRPISGLINQFLCYYLLSPMLLSYAVQSAKATAGQFNLTLEICRNLFFPLPPLEEQKEIVKYIDKSFCVITELEKSVSFTSQYSQSLNQSILSKAFKGELVEQDPNDEPASVLLERIQKEREKEKAKVKQTGAKKLKK